MVFAFSRDGALPFSSLWRKVNNQEVPIYAVWLSVSISFCMALTVCDIFINFDFIIIWIFRFVEKWNVISLQSLGSMVAFEAMVSIATIGLYIAYALPILFRVTLAQKDFVPGPFNLGRYGVIVGWVAVLWVLIISILFSLPVSYPITMETLNYTPVAVGCLLILVVSFWLISGRHWFKGPIITI